MNAGQTPSMIPSHGRLRDSDKTAYSFGVCDRNWRVTCGTDNENKWNDRINANELFLLSKIKEGEQRGTLVRMVRASYKSAYKRGTSCEGKPSSSQY